MPSAFCYHAKPGGGKSEDLFPGDKSEHPYSWLDDTEVTAMPADGRFISIYEAGEVYALENSSLAYYRATDGSPAVRLGVGTAAISPDGKWVLLASNHARPNPPLQLRPIGPGNARDLATPGLIAFDHYTWSDDVSPSWFTVSHETPYRCGADHAPALGSAL